MSDPKPRIRYLFLQPVPANTPPSTWVVRVDQAMLAGLGVWALIHFVFGFLLWRSMPGIPELPDVGTNALTQMLHYPATLVGQFFSAVMLPPWPTYAWIDNPLFGNALALNLRLLPGFLLGLWAGIFVFSRGLTPWRNLRWIAGPRLLERQEAVQAALRVAAHERAGFGLKPEEPGFMKLGPYLDLPKQWWTRGMWLWGSPGSGKTVILLGVLQQLYAMGTHAKSICYDVKGDFTQYFVNFDQKGGGDIALLCPWDKRSLRWNVAQDVRTPATAAVFAEAIIPNDQAKDPFWTNAARALLEGTLRSLMNECGTNWGWTLLRDRLAADPAAWAARMEKHHPAMKALVADPKSQQVANILGSLASYTKIIDDLAMAWPDPKEGELQRPSIAFSAWARDDYGADGARVPRHIILQAGPSAAQTRALFGTLLRVLTPELLSPKLPDNEMGRTVALVIDEMPSLGRLDWVQLVERGRSKGIICLGCAQTPMQLTEVYSPEFTKGLGSMIGLQLYLRVSPGVGRDELAEAMGKARWAITAVTTSAQGNSSSVHEENRNAVQSYELSEALGRRKKRPSKDSPQDWCIRGIVSGVGPDHLMLDFPGIALTKRRSAHKPAAWTLPQGKARSVPATSAPPGSTGGQAATVPAGTEEQRQSHLAMLKSLYDEDRAKAIAREAREEPRAPDGALQGQVQGQGQGTAMAALQARLAQLQSTPALSHPEPEENPVMSAVVGAALDTVAPGLGHVAHGLELLDAATPPAIDAEYPRQR